MPNEMETGLPSTPGSSSAKATAINAPIPEPRSLARQALADIAWLQGVPGPTLDALAAEAVMHRVPTGSLLFEQAETPAFAQFLLAGSIALLGVRDRAETLVELLRPVDMVIPAAAISGQPYLMRARVYEEAHLLLIRAPTFRETIAADHAFCRAMLACVAAQFRRQVRMQKNLKLRSAEERVGCYLVALIDQAGPGETVRLPAEKRLIASQLGMTRETLSRCLAAIGHGLLVRGDVVVVEDEAAARATFPLDPLIDGAEPIARLNPATTPHA